MGRKVGRLVVGRRGENDGVCDGEVDGKRVVGGVGGNIVVILGLEILNVKKYPAASVVGDAEGNNVGVAEGDLVG